MEKNEEVGTQYKNMLFKLMIGEGYGKKCLIGIKERIQEK